MRLVVVAEQFPLQKDSIADEVADGDPVNEQMRLMMLRDTTPVTRAIHSTFRINLPEDLEEQNEA